MVFSEVCPPALIYLAYSIIQISIDTASGMYNTALVKNMCCNLYLLSY